MSFTENYSDEFESDAEFEYLKGKQRNRTKPETNYLKQLSDSKVEYTPLQNVHPFENYWKPGEAIPCDMLNDTLSGNSSCVVKEADNDKEMYNPNKTLPCKTSSQTKISVVNARRVSMPSKFYSHGIAKYRAISHVVPSFTSGRKTKLQKQAPSAPKQTTPVAAQRLLSARKMRIDGLRNQITDLERQLHEALKEKKYLKTLYERQQKELTKIANTRGEIPAMERAHDEEVRIIRTRNRMFQDKLRELDFKLKDKDQQLRKMTFAFQNAKVSLDRKEDSESEYRKTVNALKKDLQEKDNTIQVLNKKVEALFHELSDERLEHQETRAICEKLQSDLQESTRLNTTHPSIYDSKKDILNSSVGSSGTDATRKHRSRRKKSATTERYSNREHKGSSNVNAQLSTRKKEFSTSELSTLNEKHSQPKESPIVKNTERLSSTGKKEFSIRNNLSTASKMQKDYLPANSAIRSKHEVRDYMTSPEKIFSRLQNMRLDDVPHILPPSEGQKEFPASMKEKLQHNLESRYIDLDNDVLTNFPISSVKKGK